MVVRGRGEEGGECNVFWGEIQKTGPCKPNPITLLFLEARSGIDSPLGVEGWGRHAATVMIRLELDFHSWRNKMAALSRDT